MVSERVLVVDGRTLVGVGEVLGLGNGRIGRASSIRFVGAINANTSLALHVAH